jgi:protein-S-isoprenylcysteine O-methyltransferase Ste14
LEATLFGYIIASAAVSGWCILHSALISPAVVGRIRALMGARFKYYRILYNIWASLSFAAVLYYLHLLKTPSVWNWAGYWLPVRWLVLLGGLYFIWAGAKAYDLWQYFGFRQLLSGETHLTLSKNGHLSREGILGKVRHPWYTGTILIIWARPMDRDALIANIILTLYTLIGTLLEERKLLTEFGDEYASYRQTVPMLIPFLPPACCNFLLSFPSKKDRN